MKKIKEINEKKKRLDELGENDDLLNQFNLLIRKEEKIKEEFEDKKYEKDKQIREINEKINKKKKRVDELWERSDPFQFNLYKEFEEDLIYLKRKKDELILKKEEEIKKNNKTRWFSNDITVWFGKSWIDEKINKKKKRVDELGERGNLFQFNLYKEIEEDLIYYETEKNKTIKEEKLRKKDKNWNRANKYILFIVTLPLWFPWGGLFYLIKRNESTFLFYDSKISRMLRKLYYYEVPLLYWFPLGGFFHLLYPLLSKSLPKVFFFFWRWWYYHA